MNLQAFRVYCDAQRGMQICCIRYSDLHHWIPELAEGLRFSRGQVREIRLVVCINAGHQLDIRTIVVREASIPGVPELMVSPRPLFLTGSNVRVCNMHPSCSGCMLGGPR